MELRVPACPPLMWNHPLYSLPLVRQDGNVGEFWPKVFCCSASTCYAKRHGAGWGDFFYFFIFKKRNTCKKRGALIMDLQLPSCVFLTPLWRYPWSHNPDLWGHSHMPPTPGLWLSCAEFSCQSPKAAPAYFIRSFWLFIGKLNACKMLFFQDACGVMYC